MPAAYIPNLNSPLVVVMYASTGGPYLTQKVGSSVAYGLWGFTVANGSSQLAVTTFDPFTAGLPTI